MKRKFKVAFICIYSHPSICGVWSRVYNLSRMLIKKGNEVHVFSSNIIKGTKENSSEFEVYEGIKIHRFKPKFSFGENVKFWDFSKEIKNLNPDIIIAEVYRHPHTSLALKIAEELKKPCFLVTHAPFVEPELRSYLGNALASFYDRFYGRKIINKFDKVITITKWEIPFLIKLGVKSNKMIYLPNGIPEEFFKSKPKKGKGLLFLGRIAPIKDIETLIRALKLITLKHPDIKLKIIGPAKEEYKSKIVSLIKEMDLQKNIDFLPAIYDLNRKIKAIDESSIFILPSLREAMPQSLIEAMSRGKIVIASDNKGSKEIIKNKKEGFLFPIHDYSKLAEIINFCLDKKNERTLGKITKNAVSKSKKFKWEKIFNKFYKIIKK